MYVCAIAARPPRSPPPSFRRAETRCLLSATRSTGVTQDASSRPTPPTARPTHPWTRPGAGEVDDRLGPAVRRIKLGDPAREGIPEQMRRDCLATAREVLHELVERDEIGGLGDSGVLVPRDVPDDAWVVLRVGGCGVAERMSLSSMQPEIRHGAILVLPHDRRHEGGKGQPPYAAGLLALRLALAPYLGDVVFDGFDPYLVSPPVRVVLDLRHHLGEPRAEGSEVGTQVVAHLLHGPQQFPWCGVLGPAARSRVALHRGPAPSIQSNEEVD